MRNLIKIKLLLALLAFSVIMGLTSCQTENPVTTSEDFTSNFVSYGTQVEPIVVSDMSLTNEMTIMNEVLPNKVEKGGMLGGKTPMYRFDQIFKNLNLTEDQKAQIKIFFDQHIPCVQAARQAYMDKVQSIIDEANALRKDIMDQVKAGTLDKVTAKEQLKALQEDTKAKIEATGAKAELDAALKACTDALIANIRGILTPEQQTKFDAWFANGPSTGGGNKGGGNPGGGKNGGKEDPSKKHSNFLYDTLKFDDAQKASADAFWKARIDCERAAHEAYKAKINQIYQAFEAQRKDIMDQLKAGTIDKTTAHDMMKALDDEIKSQIEASGARAELDAALKLCLDEFIEKLKSIMTEDQKALFDQLLADKKINFSSNPTVGPKK